MGHIKFSCLLFVYPLYVYIIIIQKVVLKKNKKPHPLIALNCIPRSCDIALVMSNLLCPTRVPPLEKIYLITSSKLL